MTATRENPTRLWWVHIEEMKKKMSQKMKKREEEEESSENWKFLSLRKWQLTPVIHGNWRINDYWLPGAITWPSFLPEAISYSDGHKYYLKLAVFLSKTRFGNLFQPAV